MNTPRRSTRLEFTLCLLLIAVAILAWLGFISFLHATSTEGAAFRFMASHLRLGESPEFVLQIARSPVNSARVSEEESGHADVTEGRGADGRHGTSRRMRRGDVFASMGG